MSGNNSYTQKVAPQVDRLRCSACGMLNDPDRTPKGGEFHHINQVINDGTRDVTCDGNGPQGCRFCGCTAWLNGGSLGDMNPGFTGR
jgi:hypothetical protein